MKKSLLATTLLCLTIFGLTAQINFTEIDLQEAGKVYVTKTDTTTTVNLGTPSASSQNWDFSSLLMHYMSGPWFDSTSYIQYSIDFPTSNLYTYGPAYMFGGFHGAAPVSEQGMNNGYMFWRKDVDGFWAEGFLSDDGEYAGMPTHFTPHELILGTPATYGTFYSNSSQWKLNFDVNASDVDTLYQVNTEKTQECDAWGSLTTPAGTFPDVLRIHEWGVKVDSVKSYLMGNPGPALEIARDTFNNYIFITNGIHYPLVHVKADKNNVIRSIEHYAMTATMGTDKLMGEAIKIYPNPVSEYLYIDLGSKEYHSSELLVFNAIGQEVIRHSIESDLLKLDVRSLQAGMYIYVIGDKAGKFSIKR